MNRLLSLAVCLFIILNSSAQAPVITHNGSLSICAGQSLVLTVDGAAAGSTYKWRKDGAIILTETLISYTASTTGNYDVIVTTAAINDTLAPVRVTVNPKPVSIFTASPVNQCSNLPVSFTNTSTGTTLTYAWTFGDITAGAPNNTSDDKNPKHTFIGTPGNGFQNFSVSLIVTDTKGCKDTVATPITTKQIPGTLLGGTGATTYNGLPYFTQCRSVASIFTFTNLSSTNATNTNYTIKWGDATPDFDSPTFVSATHTYSVGTHKLQFIVAGQNGCKDTADYNVFVGSNPAVGLGNPGNTVICTGTSLTFPISSTGSNPPGTTYTINFNDDTPPIYYNHPAPASVTHRFDKGSCGITSGSSSGSFSNSFSASILASNPCGSSAASVVPIYVSQKAEADFTISPNDTTCINSQVTLTNSGINGNSISALGECTPGKSVWTITPATGWTLRSGILGNDFSLEDPSVWLAGSPALDVVFTIPGIYTIKLKTGGAETCGNDEIEKTICVNPTPVAAFNVNQATGCFPLVVTTANNSNTPNCGTNTYNWTVHYSNSEACVPAVSDYAFINGTSANSANPQFQFNSSGVYTIRLVTTSPSSNCTSVAVTKDIIVKTKPTLSFSLPASICQTASINPTATVNNCYATTAATYAWTFNGGTPAASTAIAPGNIVYNTAGAFNTILAVTNECGTTTSTKSIIIKPTPDVAVPANQSFCAGETTTALTFSSSSPGATYSWTNSTAAIGLISQGTGNIAAFTAVNTGTTPLIATINVTASLNGCEGISKSFTITINPKPIAPAVTSPIDYCQGETPIVLTATAAAGNELRWYTTPTGGIAAATAPTPLTTLAGNVSYYVSQFNLATACESPRSLIIVTTKTSPQISSSSSVSPTICAASNGSVILNGLTANTSYTIKYKKNSVPVSVVITANANGSATINGLNAGTYANITADLNGCTSNEVGPFTLTDPTPPSTPVIVSNSPLCSDETLNLLSSTASIGNIIYTWSGPNSFSSNQQNPSIQNVTVAASGDYTVTVSLNGCSASATKTVVVNPKPAKPLVERPLSYCLNAIATPLVATASTGNTLTWYNNDLLTNGFATAPTPSTATAAMLFYYVTQRNAAGCNSDTSIIPITVYPLISGNTIGISQILCSGTVTTPLTGTTGLAGGSGLFSYQWQLSIDNGANWADINNEISDSYSPGVINTTTQYRRVVNSGPCTNHISNIVTITIQGTLSNYDIAASQTICAGLPPALLNGQLPAGGSGQFVYQWEISTDNNNWTPILNTNTLNYQPPALTSTTYYKRKVTSGSCSAYSSVVTITVNPKPVMAIIADIIYCNNAAANSISFTSAPSTNVTYSWMNSNPLIGLAATGTGDLPIFTTTNNSNPKVPLSGTIIVTPTYNAGNVDCAGSPEIFTLTVLPTINVSPITNQVVCTGSTIPAYAPINDAGARAGTSVSYNWTVGGNGITLVNGSGTQLPSYTTINNGSTDLVATITLTPKYSYAGITCDGTVVSYTITVKSATPGATAGPDTTLCAATTYTMQASQTGSTTGTWIQLGITSATIGDISSPVTSVNGLLPGNTYQFEWKVAGFASCPSTKDTVTIVIVPAVNNLIDNAVATICAGQSINITGQQPTGGNGAYTYQWQISPDGAAWTDMTNETGIGLSFTPSQSVYVRRIVSSMPCTSESLAKRIIVQAAIANNTITADQDICINTASVLLQGSLPAGANSVYQYQWQSSTDGGNTWANLPGANDINYNPGVLNTTTIFKRIVTSDLCSGPQSSNSNNITIHVNGDAKAIFTALKDTACAPFFLDPSVIALQLFPENNNIYNWYANGNFIGTGTSFPGYTINNPNDSVTIKLVTLSGHGCKPDSLEHEFHTYITPLPSFTISDTVGCGPLTVAINNTTPELLLFTYAWDFGNGQVSTLAQPGSIIFDPNPDYGDTTYIIRLKVISWCDTLTVTKSVHVKSKPRALFAPTISVGCSPMLVTFNNTSPGIGNSYSWDFGDGTTLNTATAESVSHLFISGVRDTFYVKLNAVNECGADSLRYAIVVSPNTIKLDFAVNGDEQTGCSPHTVRFINNSKGASNFTWNFGDGNVVNTQKNIDTLTHNFLLAGVYTITLRATNGCSDTTSTETITVYPTPRAAFDATIYTACIGDAVSFTNLSDNATSFQWEFGDGAVSNESNPTHHYANPGTYNVILNAYHFNAPGSVCSDTITRQVQVLASLPGSFSATDTVSYCAPFTITFANQNIPSTSANWVFDDGTTGTGNSITHTFLQAGTYEVKLTVIVPGGCTYITTRTVKVLGPSGELSYTAGYLCNERAARFQVQANNTDTLVFNFGDGNIVATTSNIISHAYPNAGSYLPSVTLKNKAGCEVIVPGIDSIKVDKIKAGFYITPQQLCGSTSVNFTDTSRSFFGTASLRWNFGDGTSGSGSSVNHIYTSGGTYAVEMIFVGNSGCMDTVRKSISVIVNNIPVAVIKAETSACTGFAIPFNSNIQSADAINIIQWSISNGVTNNSPSFAYSFTEAGTYTVRLVAGTVNGCFDTVVQSIRVNPSPVIKATNDLSLCLGSSTRLNATGSNQLVWSPVEGLNCITCPDPVAAPLITTPYVVQGTNNFGCAGYDTVVVTVIQPLQLRISADDSICIGQSANLLGSGATSYNWSPAAGLNSTTISNPVATPVVTTRYRVVGYDGFNCFTDTAFVLVAVGQYPAVSLGPDLVLSTGTEQSLVSAVQNGPIAVWNWTPATDLSCNTCPLPIATIKKDISYIVSVKTFYGCSASDTISIKVFCENTQVFIPNAFTPDNDGVNDVFMVHGRGIVMVKSLRVFNRWGELVFEKSSFAPNNPALGWDGKVRGVAGGPDVFVYTAEVICENGSSYNYKGNVSIIK